MYIYLDRLFNLSSSHLTGAVISTPLIFETYLISLVSFTSTATKDAACMFFFLYFCLPLHCAADVEPVLLLTQGRVNATLAEGFQGDTESGHGLWIAHASAELLVNCSGSARCDSAA